MFAGIGWSQPFTAGVKVGLPLTDFVNTVSGQSSAVTNRYLVGPTAELHLPFGLAIEVDALYRHFKFQDVTSNIPGNPGYVGPPVTSVSFLNKAGAWEFPLLLKYRFHGELVRPYVDAGMAWDRITGVTSTISGVVPNPEALVQTYNPIGETHSTTTGFVMGGGLDIHLVVHIMPELRYTRWTSQHFNISNVVNSNQNQAEFMVGVTF